MQREPIHATGAQLSPDGPGRSAIEPANAAIIRLAAAQRGLATRPQLLAAGFSSREVEGRIRSGLLQRARRGIYRVGAVPQPREREMAALLTCGVTARLSFSSAALLHGLGGGGVSNAATRPVEVTISGGYRRSDAGKRVHRAPLVPDEIAVVDSLPVTSLARTVLDLAATRGTADRPAADPERLLAEALRLQPDLAGDLLTLFHRYPGHVGTARLRPWVVTGEARFTRSEAEALFLEILRDAGLPLPRCNIRLLGVEVDCFWKQYALVAEIDGYRVHSSRAAFENDRQRDARLLAAGYRVMRFSWRQLETRPGWVAVQVGQAMARTREA